MALSPNNDRRTYASLSSRAQRQYNSRFAIFIALRLSQNNNMFSSSVLVCVALYVSSHKLGKWMERVRTLYAKGKLHLNMLYTMIDMHSLTVFEECFRCTHTSVRRTILNSFVCSFN